MPAAELLLADEFDGLAEEVAAAMDAADLSGALDALWLRVRRLNRFVEEQAPWKIAKDPEQSGQLESVLATLVEGIRVITVLLHPFLPETTAKLLAVLGAEDVAFDGTRGLQPGKVTQVGDIDPLFPKLQTA